MRKAIKEVLELAFDVRLLRKENRRLTKDLTECMAQVKAQEKTMESLLRRVRQCEDRLQLYAGLGHGN